MSEDRSSKEGGTENGGWERGPVLRARTKRLMGGRIAGGRPVGSLTVTAGLFAVLALFLMRDDPSFLLCAALAGTIAALLDYAVEHAGITRSRWDYPRDRLPIGRVPLAVPLLFFLCGVIATLVVFLLHRHQLVTLDPPAPAAGIVAIQIALVILACHFTVQYAAGRLRSLTFGALPLSLALFLFIPEPVLLALSVLPVYIDYYLEKRLVKGSSIIYEGYNEQTAINVALSYLPTTLLMFDIVAALAVIL